MESFPCTHLFLFHHCLGEYEYLGAAFGDLVAFLFVWGFVIIIVPASFALTALTFSDYALKPFFIDCEPPYYARLFLAAAAMSKYKHFALLVYQFISWKGWQENTKFTVVSIFGILQIWSDCLVRFFM